MKILIVFLLLFIALCVVSKNWKTVLKVMSGWGVMEVFNFFYENPFWMWMQHHFGIFWGSIYVSALAIFINLVLIIWYQWAGKDWLGVNVLEDIKKDGAKWVDRVSNHQKWYVRILSYPFAKMFQLVLWSLNKNDLTIFLVFSVLTDSFITTAFMRHGRSGRLGSRDAKIFAMSSIISCIVWSVWCACWLQIAKLGTIVWNLI